MYVGTYTTWKEGGKGIYIYRYDARSGKITYVDVAKGIDNPTFLITDPQKRYLFAVNELGNRKGGASSFYIDPSCGALSPVTTQPVGSDGPCHLALDHQGTTLFTANYSGGSVSVLPVKEGDLLQPFTTLLKHEGRGPDASRQLSPHPHEVVMDPVEELLYVPDLGLDKVFIYRTQDSRQPVPADPPYLETPPGGGPRHLVFSPDRRDMYVVLDMATQRAERQLRKFKEKLQDHHRAAAAKQHGRENVESESAALEDEETDEFPLENESE